ncbi:MAG TPA: hypothetical protein VG222_19705 [Vicinamibacterales bacterium]|jgi:hypothetical protein|nr:hypothetical protein [Vicinamibacterales bacterium]
MLVPLLATPFHDPFVNLLVQGWLTTFAALLAPFLVARYVGADRYWIAAGALANACLFLVAAPGIQFDWLITQPYALSMSLGVASLLLADRFGKSRTAVFVALVLMLAAHWVNLAVCVVLVPLILARGRATLQQVSLTGAGVAGGTLLKHWSTGTATATKILSVAEWPHGWAQLLRTTSAGIAHPWGLIALVLFALIGAIVLSRRAPLDKSITGAVVAFVSACCYWLVIGTFEHVQHNDYYARYVFPSVLLFAVGMALLVVAAGHRPRVAAAIACLVFVVSAGVSYGVPSLKRLRRNMDRTIGVLTPDIMAADATVLAGDYWTVWPAVFHANMILYERTGHVGVFGLTYRSDQTAGMWLTRVKTDPVVLVAPRLDTSAALIASRLGVPVTFVRDAGPLDVYLVGTHRD